MNPWLERVHQRSRTAIASPLSTRRNGNFYTPRAQGDFSRPRESAMKLQSCQRLVNQFCDSADHNSEMNRDSLGNLVQFMLELCDTPEFEPESFGHSQLVQFLQIAVNRIEREFAVAATSRSGSSDKEWWSVGDWRSLVRRCSPIVDPDMTPEERFVSFQTTPPDPSCWGLLLVVHALSHYPSLQRACANAHLPALLARVLLLLSARFTDPGVGVSAREQAQARVHAVATVAKPKKHAQSNLSRMLNQVAGSQGSDEEDEDDDEEEDQFFGAVSSKPIHSRGHPQSSRSALSLTPNSSSSASATSHWPDPSSHSRSSSGVMSFSVDPDGDSESQWSSTYDELKILEGAGLVEWHCLGLMRLLCSHASVVLDLVATQMLVPLFKLLANFSLPALVRTNVHDILLGAVGVGPLGASSSVASSSNDFSNSLPTSIPLPLDVFSHLQVHRVLPLLLSALKVPEPDVIAELDSCFMSPFTILKKPLSESSSLTQSASRAKDGTVSARSTPLAGSLLPILASVALPSVEDGIVEHRRTQSHSHIKSPPPALSELNDRVVAYYSGHAAESVPNLAQWVLLLIRVIVAWIRESIRVPTPSLWQEFERSDGINVLVNAIAWLSKNHRPEWVIGNLIASPSQSMPSLNNSVSDLPELNELVALLAVFPFIGVQELPAAKPDPGACPVPIEIPVSSNKVAHHRRGGANNSGASMTKLGFPVASILSMGTADMFGTASNVHTQQSHFDLIGISSASPYASLCVPSISRIRSTASVRALSDLFVQSSNSSPRLQTLAVTHLRQIFSSHPSNYLLTWDEKVLASCLQSCFDASNIDADSDDSVFDVQFTCLDLVLFVASQLHFVPFQELITLSNNLQRLQVGNTQLFDKVSKHAFHSVCQLLDFSNLFQDVLRESGLLDVVIPTTIRLELQLQTSAAISSASAAALNAFQVPTPTSKQYSSNQASSNQKSASDAYSSLSVQVVPSTVSVSGRAASARSPLLPETHPALSPASDAVFSFYSAPFTSEPSQSMLRRPEPSLSSRLVKSSDLTTDKSKSQALAQIANFADESQDVGQSRVVDLDDDDDSVFVKPSSLRPDSIGSSKPRSVDRRQHQGNRSRVQSSQVAASSESMDSSQFGPHQPASSVSSSSKHHRHRRSDSQTLTNSNQLHQLMMKELEHLATPLPSDADNRGNRRRSSVALYRQISHQHRNNSLPPLDLPHMELVLRTLFKILNFNRHNQGIFAAADGQRVLLGLIQHNALRDPALQLIENIVETFALELQAKVSANSSGSYTGIVAAPVSSSAAFSAAAASLARSAAGMASPTASTSATSSSSSISYENFDLRLMGSGDVAQIEMLLGFLSSPRCHIFAKCQVMRSLRRMCLGSVRAQLAFQEHQGFSKLFGLVSSCSLESLRQDSFIISQCIRVELAALRHAERDLVFRDRIQSMQVSQSSSFFSSEQQNEVLLSLANQYSLLMLQEMFSCATAAVRKNKRHRERWAQERSVFTQLFESLRESGILNSPSGPNFISIWLMWLATEYVPVISDDSSPLVDSLLNPLSKSATKPSSMIVSPMSVSDSTPSAPSLSPFISSIQQWLVVDGHHLDNDLYASHTSNDASQSTPMSANIRLIDPSIMSLPEQGVFHNAAAATVAIQVVSMAPISFQLRLLEYIFRQSQLLSINQSLLCNVDVVSSLVNTYRSLLLESTSEADHMASVRSRRSNTVLDRPSSVSKKPPTTLSEDRRVLVLSMIRYFATFSCSGNDVRALVSLLNAPHPRWQVALDLLIDAVQTEQHAGGSSVGPYSQFHLSRKGFACLHIPVVSSPSDRAWPPSSGYTFAVWLYIDRFGESNNDTPVRLLSLVSADSKSITDSYIRNRHLVLQTAPNQMVSFDDFKFEERKWYHVALTHTKHIITTSTVRLFVNGELVQTERLAYVSNSSALVSAWLGTPPQYQISSKIQWRMASCVFLDDALSEDKVPRLFREGPNLAGIMHSASKHVTIDVLQNYYARSAATAEAFKSTSGGSSLSSSSKIVDSVLPPENVVFTFHAQNFMQASHLYPTLGVQSALMRSEPNNRNSNAEEEDVSKNLSQDWQSRLDMHDLLLLNSARPTVSHAVIRGDVQVYYPVSLADALRQIGGLRVLLPLFERRLSADSLRKVLILFALLLRDSPKTLREMDQIHGFSLIAQVLKRQEAPFDLTMLELLASYCGLAQSCTAGQIAATSAFQAFFMDYTLWHHSPPPVQQMLFQGILATMKENPNGQRHAQILRAMNTLPWALTVLTDPELPQTVVPHVVALIKGLLLDHLRVDDLHHVANFILSPTVFENSDSQNTPVSEQLVSARTASPTPTHSGDKTPSVERRTSKQSSASHGVKLRWHSSRALLVRHLLLHALLLLSLQLQQSAIGDFIKVINYDWLFGVLDAASDDKHPVGAVLTLRLMLVLFKRAGADWLVQFHKDTGFTALAHLLRPYCGCGGVYHALLLMIFGSTTAAADPQSLLPLQVSLEAQDEHSLDLETMNHAFAQLSQSLPEALAVERVLAALGPSMMNAQLVTGALQALFFLLHHSMLTTSVESATVVRAIVLKPQVPVTATQAAVPKPIIEKPVQSAPASTSLFSRFESFFSSSSESKPSNAPPKVETRPPPPSVAAPTLPKPQLEAQSSTAPASTSVPLRQRAALGGLKVSISNPNSQLLSHSGEEQSSGWSPQASPIPDSKSLFRHLPPPSILVEAHVISVFMELYRVSEQLRNVCVQPGLWAELTSMLVDTANIAKEVAFNKKSTQNLSILEKPPTSEQIEDAASLTLPSHRSRSSSILEPENVSQLEPDCSSVDSILPSFQAWKFASSMVQVGSIAYLNSAFAIDGVPAAEAGGSGSNDGFRHPTAERFLEWLPHVLWLQLCQNPKGSQVLDEILLLIPTISTPLRTALLTRVHLGLAALVRRHVDDDYLDQYDRLGGNLSRLLTLWTEHISQGWLARGTLVIVETLFIMIERFVEYRRHRSFVQQIYASLNKIVLLTLARPDLNHVHRAAVDEALLARFELFFGEYNSDRGIFIDLLYYLCAHLLLLPPTLNSTGSGSVPSGPPSFSAASLLENGQSNGGNSHISPNAVIIDPTFVLPPTCSASEFELRNNAMQLMAQLLTFKLSAVAEYLLGDQSGGNSSNAGSPFDIFTGGFEKLIEMDLNEFLIWLTKHAYQVKAVMDHRLASLVGSRVSVWMKERGTQLVAHLAQAQALFEKRERDLGELDSQQSDLELQLWSHRRRIKDNVSTALLRARQRLRDRSQFVRSSWGSLRAEMRHLRVVSAPAPLGEPLQNPQQISLELLDMITEDTHADSEEIKQLALALATASEASQSSPFFRASANDPASISTVSASPSHKSLSFQPLSNSLGRWNDRCIVGTEYLYTSHSSRLLRLYQRWRLDFTESTDRIRKRLERPSFRAADVLAWVRACQRSIDQEEAISSHASHSNSSSPPTSAAVVASSPDASGPASRFGQNSQQSSSFFESQLDQVASHGNDHTSDSPASSSAQDSSPHSQEQSENVQPDNERSLLESERLYLLLEPGDKIVYHCNCSRLIGADELRGVLLVCENNLYLVDNFQIQSDGTIVDLLAVSNARKKSAAAASPALQIGVNRLASAAALASSALSRTSSQPSKSQLRSESPFQNSFDDNDANDVDSDEDHLDDENLNRNEFESSHECLKRDLSQLVEVQPRRYLLQPTALEVYFSDGINYLLILEMVQRDSVYSLLLKRCKEYVAEVPTLLGSSGGGLLDMLGFNLFQASHLSNVTWRRRQQALVGADPSARKNWLKLMSEAWQQGHVSNFDYLLQLNSLSGRTFNDLTQYPVFPWVLSDYSSTFLDLHDAGGQRSSVFRNLSKPMGALSEPRAAQFRQRYADWDDPSDQAIPKFHYGTHYSSAAVVLYYMLRLEPFTEHVLQLQSGRFDRPDRLFHSIQESWLSASQQASADVKELIPEFFFLPEMLQNGNRMDFGWRQSGAKVDDVVLPAWAHGNARHFIRMHRRALESPAVSARIHEWIDLIFGYKQRGPAAVEAQNVFYYLTYEGNIDVSAISDPLMKAATIEQIRSFGQTPGQLFVKPHPPRLRLPTVPDVFLYPSSLELREVRSVGYRVEHMVALSSEGSDSTRLITAGAHQILVPAPESTPQKMVFQRMAWGFPDGTLRFSRVDESRDNMSLALRLDSSMQDQQLLQQVYKNMHDGPVRRAVFTEDGFTLVTGGLDSVVCIWSKRRARDPFSFVSALSGLRGAISALAVSKCFSLVAAGAQDGSVLVWDLNRLVCIRRLDCFGGQQIVSLVFDSFSGDLVVATSHALHIFDVNMRKLMSHAMASDRSSDAITALLVSEAPLDQNVDAYTCLVTGHQDGSFRVWHFVYAPVQDHSESQMDADIFMQYDMVQREVESFVDIGPAEKLGDDAPHEDSNSSTPESSLPTSPTLHAVVVSDPLGPGQPPVGALDLEINKNRNPNPKNYTWHLQLVKEVGGSTQLQQSSMVQFDATNSTPQHRRFFRQADSTNNVVVSNARHGAPITALTLSSTRDALWVADADGLITTWAVPSSAVTSTHANGVVKSNPSEVSSSLSSSDKKRPHPALLLPMEASSQSTIQPCAVCEKTRYKSRERRVMCRQCEEWMCADCQLQHIRTSHV